MIRPALSDEWNGASTVHMDKQLSAVDGILKRMMLT